MNWITKNLGSVLVLFALAGLAPCGTAALNSTNRAASLASKPDLQFTRLGLTDGLSHADVRRAVRDSQGFMWFATWLDGVNRYDGYSFKVYRHDAKDERSLAFDNVAIVYEDRQQTLWVGTYGGGLDRYDRETDSFIHYRHRPGDTNSLAEDTIRALYEDEKGRLWVGTGAGVCLFDREKETFWSYPGTSVIRAICMDRRTGLLWLGALDGVSVLDCASGKFERLQNSPGDSNSLSDNRVNEIFQARNGDIWVGTDIGLDRWNPETKNFVRYLSDPDNPASLGNDFVAAIYEDRSGRFWVGSSSGLDLFDLAGGTFFHYRNDPNDPASLSANNINLGGIYEDDTGALWISTHDAGVNRLDGRPPKFVTFRHNPGETNSLSQNTATALYSDHAGNLWIGTVNGLDCWDGKSFVHYVSDPKNTNTISPGPVWAITEGRDHEMWIGANGGGICRFDGTNFTRYRHNPANPRSLGGDFMYGLLTDRHGGLWISVHGAGLDYFDGREFTHFRPDKDNTNDMPELYVGSLVLDQEDCVWMGSANMGLIRFDPAKRKATTYLLDAQRPHSKVGNWVRDINSDGKTIWVAAYSGLFAFDIASKKFTHCFTEQDGMASSSVVSVQPDADGNIWAATMAGLSKLDVRSGTFHNYSAAGAFQSAHFCERARTRLSDGRLSFGTVNGFKMFSSNLPENGIPPPVVLTEFQLFNKPVALGKGSPLKKAIHVADSIILQYKQEVFRLKFAALDFSAPLQNRYACMLDGFDNEWRYPEASDRSATYTRLDPGKYTFRVKAANNDGLWNEKGVSISIIIMPPWWRTAAFEAAFIAAVLLLVYAGYRFRVNSIEKRSRELERQVHIRTAELETANRELGQANEKLKDLERLKSLFIASMSHELRTPLNSIIGFSSILLQEWTGPLNPEQKDNLSCVLRSGKHLLALINDVIDVSKIEAGNLEPSIEEFDLAGVIEEAISVVAGDIRTKKLELSVRSDSHKLRTDRRRLLQCVINLLSNAVKFTPAGSVGVRAVVDKIGNKVEISVSDTGIGIPPEDLSRLFNPFVRLDSPLRTKVLGTGLGLYLSRKIAVELLGGDISVTSEPGKGSRFVLHLPCSCQQL